MTPSTSETNAWTPVVSDLTGAMLGLPAPGEEREWAEQNFLPVQRELAAWLHAGTFLQDDMPAPGKTVFLDTDDTPVWFIGDMHGDFLALLLALNLAHTYDHSLLAHHGGLPLDVPTHLFFLGDFIDEGPHAAETVAWLLASRAGQTFGGQRFSFTALVGNHDEGLAYDEKLRGFWTPVTPSNFFWQLNYSSCPLAIDFGKAVCSFFRGLPRMALLNNTIMAVHGGIPRAELTAAIRNMEDLESAVALDDYIWGHLLEDRYEGIPDKRGDSVWIDHCEFDRFIKVFGRIKGAEPRLLLRGHDHKPRNFKWLERYRNCRVLTLNNFTVNERGPAVGARYRPVTLARINRPLSDPLDVHVFQFDLLPSLIEHCRNLPSILENIF